MAINVLVVDDSKVMRSMLIKTLKLTGLPLGEIYQGANGREGLTALEDNWIDLVLADINMPVMNGEEMIEVIRENPTWKELPIVVIRSKEYVKHRLLTFLIDEFFKTHCNSRRIIRAFSNIG